MARRRGNGRRPQQRKRGERGEEGEDENLPAEPRGAQAEKETPRAQRFAEVQHARVEAGEEEGERDEQAGVRRRKREVVVEQVCERTTPGQRQPIVDMIEEASGENAEDKRGERVGDEYGAGAGRGQWGEWRGGEEADGELGEGQHHHQRPVGVLDVEIIGVGCADTRREAASGNVAGGRFGVRRIGRGGEETGEGGVVMGDG